MQQEINNLKWKNKCSLTSMIFWSIKRKMHFSLFCYESFFWPNLLIVKVSFGQMDHCHHHLAVVLQCAAKILIQATINHSVFKMKRTNVHWSQWSSVPFNLTNACPFLMIKNMFLFLVIHHSIALDQGTKRWRRAFVDIHCSENHCFLHSAISSLTVQISSLIAGFTVTLLAIKSFLFWESSCLPCCFKLSWHCHHCCIHLSKCFQCLLFWCCFDSQLAGAIVIMFIQQRIFTSFSLFVTHRGFSGL